MNYGLLKTLSQIGKYSLLIVTASSGWISLQYKTTEENGDLRHRKNLTSAGKTYRVLIVVSAVLAIASAMSENYADNKLRTEAEDRGNKKVADLLESQHKKYIGDVKRQIETSVVPEIRRDTKELHGAAHETLAEISGGDSFGVVSMTGEKGFGLEIKGDYPLYDLNVDVHGYQDKLEQHQIFPNVSPHVYQPWFRYDFSAYTELNYMVMFTARNGAWWETLQLRRVAGRWTEAIRVEQPILGPHNFVRLDHPVKTRVRYQWVSPAYPLTNGQVSWCKFMFTALPVLTPNPCIS
jgi:hypothetical protein